MSSGLWKKEKRKKLISLVRSVDQNHILREGYRALATIEYNLERKWATRYKITEEINKKIEIIPIDIQIIRAILKSHSFTCFH